MDNKNEARMQDHPAAELCKKDKEMPMGNKKEMAANELIKKKKLCVLRSCSGNFLRTHM
jgi:hypothetical protein